MPLCKPSYPRLRRDHPLARGLRVAWPVFEATKGRILDVSGNGYHGTMAPLTLVTSNASGPVVDMYGSPPQFVDAGTQDFGTTTLLPDPPYKWSICTRLYRPAGANGWFLGVNTGNGTGSAVRMVRFSGNPSVGLRGSVASFSSDIADVWTPIVITWDGELGRAYLNGKLDFTLGVGVASSSKTNFYLGHPATGGPNNRATNRQEDLRIYDRALTDDEVLEIAENPWDLYREPNKYWLFGVGQDGLQLNFDASRMEGLSEGDPVEVIPDFSPNGYDTALGTSGPYTYRENSTPTGKPTLFVPGNRHAPLPDPAHGILNGRPGMSFFFVGEMQDTGTRQSFLFFTTSASGSTARLTVITDLSNQFISLSARDTDASTLVATTGDIPIKYATLQVHFAQANLPGRRALIRWQGAEAATVEGIYSSNAFSLTDSVDANVFGRTNTQPAHAFKGDFGELLLFNRPLAEEEYLAIERMLLEKWVNANQTLDTADALMPQLAAEQGFLQDHIIDSANAFQVQIVDPPGSYLQNHQFLQLDSFMPMMAGLSRFTDSSEEMVVIRNVAFKTPRLVGTNFRAPE